MKARLCSSIVDRSSDARSHIGATFLVGLCWADGVSSPGEKVSSPLFRKLACCTSIQMAARTGTSSFGGQP